MDAVLGRSVVVSADAQDSVETEALEALDELRDVAGGVPSNADVDRNMQSLGDIAGLVGRVQVINVKLDKCGGLTEGLAMAETTRMLGMECMVGNMIGTSLAMAPAFLLGQYCKIVDLDGPKFLKADRPIQMHYADGTIDCPPGVWGLPT